MYKNIFIFFLLIYGVFGGGVLDIFDNDIIPNPQPKPPQKILNIDIPSQDVIDRVSIFSEIITDPSDKAKIAIFNYEFGERVLEYNTSSQKVNDIYTLAGKIFFQKTLVDKYDGLSEEITELLKECMTDENHNLTDDERNKLSKYFTGIAWVLIQRGE